MPSDAKSRGAVTPRRRQLVAATRLRYTMIALGAGNERRHQTESVIRSAIKERVKPVLFINKIDRLIKELKLSAPQVQERFSKIIHDVNQLITKAVGEDTLNWNVIPEAETVPVANSF